MFKVVFYNMTSKLNIAVVKKSPRSFMKKTFNHNLFAQQRNVYNKNPARLWRISTAICDKKCDLRQQTNLLRGEAVSLVWMKELPYFTWNYLSIYSDQQTAKWPFQSSIQAATCYYQSNHSKVEAFSLSALPKDTTSKLVDCFLFL